MFLFPFLIRNLFEEGGSSCYDGNLAQKSHNHKVYWRKIGDKPEHGSLDDKP
jgi:hypothetical protein